MVERRRKRAVAMAPHVRTGTATHPPILRGSPPSCHPLTSPEHLPHPPGAGSGVPGARLHSDPTRPPRQTEGAQSGELLKIVVLARVACCVSRRALARVRELPLGPCALEVQQQAGGRDGPTRVGREHREGGPAAAKVGGHVQPQAERHAFQAGPARLHAAGGEAQRRTASGRRAAQPRAGAAQDAAEPLDAHGDTATEERRHTTGEAHTGGGTARFGAFRQCEQAAEPKGTARMQRSSRTLGLKRCPRRCRVPKGVPRVAFRGAARVGRAQQAR